MKPDPQIGEAAQMTKRNLQAERSGAALFTEER